jgi:hypothetical protein
MAEGRMDLLNVCESILRNITKEWEQKILLLLADWTKAIEGK